MANIRCLCLAAVISLSIIQKELAKHDSHNNGVKFNIQRGWKEGKEYESRMESVARNFRSIISPRQISFWRVSNEATDTQPSIIRRLWTNRTLQIMSFMRGTLSSGINPFGQYELGKPIYTLCIMGKCIALYCVKFV